MSMQEKGLTFARGARQLVVQEALEMTWCSLGLYFSLLTPMTNIWASADGAEMITCIRRLEQIITSST